MDEGQIHFPSKLEKRICRTLFTTPDVERCGLLVGRWVDDSLLLLAAYHCLSTEAEEVRDALKDAEACFPGGLDICGMYFSYPPDTPEDSIMRNIRQLCASLKDNLYETNLLMLVAQSGGLRDNAFWYNVDARETSTVGEFTQDPELEKSMWQDLVTFRLRTTLQIIVPHNKDPAKVKHCIGVELGLQIDSIKSGKTSYHVQKSRLLLHNAEEEEEEEEGKRRKFSGIEPQEGCGEILQRIDSGEELQTRRKIKDYGQEVVNVSVLKCATPQIEKEKSAFFIYVDEVPTTYLTVTLPLDCVVVVESSEPVGNLPTMFTRALTSQLASMGKSMCQFYQDQKLPQPRPVHIKPLGLDHIVTICYPGGYTDDQLLDTRLCAHARLHIPADRPTLRASNRYVFPDERARLVYLQNTHVGLPRSGVSNGVVSCVEGVYSYHHYMQDNVNDNGWGCAYRSLQTIVSWFRHQGYTDKPVPTHPQIQQALVDVGDKEASFVGSRKWIGSTEVGFCLDHLLGVQSRFLVVNAGRDLADKGRELAQHFDTQGTPVMIGGGVLAHTILGVDFNEMTGQLKFLILDPHYTGAEDIKEIQSKGWCGWKGPDFWDQTAFYNLCMPQRPALV